MDFLYIANKDEKSNDRNITFAVYRVNFKGKVKLGVDIKIENFETFFNEYLSDPNSQLFWKEIKERFGKDADEKELLKIVKFYILLINFEALLDKAREWVISNALGPWGYDLYNSGDLFDGRLDGRTFKELLTKVWKYQTEEFIKKYGQNKEQKDEQPK
jgi:hypothetical protein